MNPAGNVPNVGNLERLGVERPFSSTYRPPASDAKSAIAELKVTRVMEDERAIADQYVARASDSTGIVKAYEPWNESQGTPDEDYHDGMVSTFVKYDPQTKQPIEMTRDAQIDIAHSGVRYLEWTQHIHATSHVVWDRSGKLLRADEERDVTTQDQEWHLVPRGDGCDEIKYPPTRSGERVHVERDLFGRMHYREKNWG